MTKKDFTSDYISPPRIGKKPTVPMDSKDPRLDWDSIGPNFSRQGAEIAVVDLNGSILPASRSAALRASNAGGSIQGPSTTVVWLEYPLLINAVTNPGPDDPTGRPKVVNISPVTMTGASWSGNDLIVNFTFDSSAGDNVHANEFIVHAVAANGSEGYSKIGLGYFKVNKTTTSQTITFTQAINSETMHGFTVAYTSFCIYAADSLGINWGDESCLVSVPTYSSGLTAPSITVASVNNGYSVSYVNPTASFSAIEVAEYESIATSEPTGVTYNTIYSNTFNPVVITSPNLNQRWVKARFIDISGTPTAYSAAQKVTPTSVINVDLLPPNELSAVSASWNVSNGINITYTMPQTDPGVRFIVILSPVSNPSAQGSFYIYPTSTSGTQTLTITKFDLFGQFGTYYTQFTGIIKSVDAADNRTSGVSFNVASITNQLALVTPNPTLTAIIDGYTVSVSNTTANVDHVEVYEYFLDPATMLDMMGTLMDYMDADYVSGGASGANTIVLNNWQDQMQMSIVNPEYCEGMAITGIGIPDNTYITSITVGPSTNYTVHLSTNLTQQASGSYHMQSLVATGNSPLSVYTGNYIKRWVVVVYYDIFENNSLFGKANPEYVIPLNPTTSLFDTAVQITSTGALYLGSSKTSVPNVLIGTNSAEAGIFVWGPNDGTTTSDTPSTQIIGAVNSPLTFITKNAQIADWLVTDTKIENTLSGTPTKYTGLSATGTYSFWAGSTVTGGNSSAKFTVTPLGAVTAREIYIVGTGDANSKIIDAGSNFYIKHDGSLYATSATITGTITANSGTFHGNVNIDSTGSLSSGTYGQSSGNSGYILNTSGLRFDYGSTQGITQLVASTGQFITTKALIGGWTIDSSSISKTNSSGTLTLDSSNAYIKASSASYSAGIKTPTSNSASDVIFWSGAVSGPSTSASFYVTGDGSLFANKATMTGTIKSSSGTNSVTIDGTHDLIQIGSGTQLFARGGNTYLSNANLLNSSYVLNQSALDSNSYFSVGTTQNAYGSVMAGLGLYAARSYINVTAENGIGIFTGAINDLKPRTGIILGIDGKLSLGSVSGSANSPAISSTGAGTITMDGSTIVINATSSIGLALDSSGISIRSGTTAYAQWSSTGVVLSPSTGSLTYLQVDGSQIKSTTTVVSGYYYGSDGLQHNNPQTQSIILGSDGLHINGLSVYGDDSRLSSISSTYSPFTRVIQYAPQSQSSGNTQINGGDAVTGFAIYYGNHSPVGSTGTGFSGDLWVQV